MNLPRWPSGEVVVFVARPCYRAGFETLLEYCRVERNGTRDVATPLARRDHRKSKFSMYME